MTRKQNIFTIFTNKEMLKECDNILRFIEILLITPFSNGELKRMFSRMFRVKTIGEINLGIID